MKTKIVIFVNVIMMTFAINTFGQVGNATTISGPTSACANTSAIYSTPIVSGATSYMWTLPAGASIISGYGTNTVTIQFASTSGQVMVFPQNGNQFGNGASLEVIVNAAPSITVTASASNICEGQSVTLTATGNGNFQWSGGETTSSITVTPTMTTSYTVTVNGSTTCNATGSVTVQVHSSPAVSLNLLQDNVCTDVHNIQLSGGLPLGGVYSSTTPNIVFDNNKIYPGITGSGTWTITYTVTNNYGCSATASDLFTVNPIPAVMFDNVSGAITTSTTSVDLNNFVQPQGGVFSGPGTTLGSSIFDFGKAGEGTHMITYTYTHPISGCSASQIQYVTVGEGQGGGTTTIEEANVSLFELYPNPAKDKLSIKGNGNIYIVDMVGKIVSTIVQINQETSVDVSTLHTGTYFIIFTNVDGFSSTHKFVKIN